MREDRTSEVSEGGHANLPWIDPRLAEPHYVLDVAAAWSGCLGMMDFRRLHYFVVLARELHYGRAAEQLHITQPGLSQQIKLLERELRVRLFVRNTHGVSLTDAGRLLLVEGDAVLRQVAELVSRVQSYSLGLSGRLRVMHTRSASHVAHTIVEEYRARFPCVSIAAEVAWTTRNLEMLRTNEADVAFVRPPLYDDATGIQVLVLCSEELAVALPASHDLCRHRRIRREDIRHEAVVHWPRSQGAGYYDHIRQQIWGDAFPHVVLEEPEAEHILAAVKSGVGVAILDLNRANRLRPQGVSIRRFAPPIPVSLLGVAWIDQSVNPALQRFISLCQEQAQHVEPP